MLVCLKMLLCYRFQQAAELHIVISSVILIHLVRLWQHSPLWAFIYPGLYGGYIFCAPLDIIIFRQFSCSVVGFFSPFRFKCRIPFYHKGVKSWPADICQLVFPYQHQFCLESNLSLGLLNSYVISFTVVSLHNLPAQVYVSLVTNTEKNNCSCSLYMPLKTTDYLFFQTFIPKQ